MRYRLVATAALLGMAQYAIPEDIFNSALLRHGEATITVGDNSAEARICRGVFEGNARAAMSVHKFGFCRKFVEPAYQGLHDRAGYYKWQLPADVISVHHVSIGDHPLHAYEIQGNQLLIRGAPFDTENEATKVWCAVSYYPPVSEWSADFAEVMVIRMEAIILKAILEDQVSARIKQQEADMKLREVVARDKYQNPPELWIVPELTPAHVRRHSQRDGAYYVGELLYRRR